MKRLVWLALVAGTTFAATAFAQSTSNPSVSPEDQLKARRAQAEANKAAALPGQLQTLTGTVKSYKEGKKIVVTDASGKNHSLKLDESARVEATLKPGDPVSVEWQIDSEGKERVSSISTGTSTGATTGTSPGTTGSAATSGTSASPSGNTPPGSTGYTGSSGVSGTAGTTAPSAAPYAGSTAPAESGSAVPPPASTYSENGQMSSTPRASGTAAPSSGTPGMYRTPRGTRTPEAGTSGSGSMQPTPVPK
jgi:hypothetical protein